MSEESVPTVGGYPLLDDGTPIPGGVMFASRDPKTGTPCVLRRYRAEWLAPADSLDTFHDRARRAMTVQHPHLTTPRDCGFQGSDVYAVVDPPSGPTLEEHVQTNGPLPAIDAANIIRQAANALKTIHDAGMVHGDVRPSRLTLGSVVVLMDFGLIPARPSGRDWAAIDPLSRHLLGYLPPERVDDGKATPPSDVYGLGATLFFLLASRAPYTANSAADVIQAIATTPPAPLATLRPDLPPGLAEFTMSLLARNPAERPTAAQVVSGLAVFIDEPVALTPAPMPWPSQSHTGSAHSDAPVVLERAAAKPPTGLTDSERSRLKIWFYLGGLFWLVALVLLFVFLNDRGCFGREEPAPGKPNRHRTPPPS